MPYFEQSAYTLPPLGVHAPRLRGVVAAATQRTAVDRNAQFARDALGKVCRLIVSAAELLAVVQRHGHHQIDVVVQPRRLHLGAEPAPQRACRTPPPAVLEAVDRFAPPAAREEYERRSPTHARQRIEPLRERIILHSPIPRQRRRISAHGAYRIGTGGQLAAADGTAARPDERSHAAQRITERRHRP